ncbi:MAG: regulatory protein MarR [Acidimicrobiales bacterium]|nr:regulatory protein MarR [Acidimicrobiales bacterium]
MCAFARNLNILIVMSDIDRDVEPFAAWRAVLLAQSRAMRAIERDLDDAHQISIMWYDVLLELNAADGRRLRMQDLAMKAVLSRTRVSRIVTELETAGLVERIVDPEDGRATLAHITADGRRALKRAAPVYLAGIDEHFTRHLTNAQQHAIVAGLHRVIDAHDAKVNPRR